MTKHFGYVKCLYSGEDESVAAAVMGVVDANSKSMESLNLSGMRCIDDQFVVSLSRTAINLKQLLLSSARLADQGLKALAGEFRTCIH